MHEIENPWHLHFVGHVMSEQNNSSSLKCGQCTIPSQIWKGCTQMLISLHLYILWQVLGQFPSSYPPLQSQTPSHIDSYGMQWEEGHLKEFYKFMNVLAPKTWKIIMIKHHLSLQSSPWRIWMIIYTAPKEFIILFSSGIQTVCYTMRLMIQVWCLKCCVWLPPDVTFRNQVSDTVFYHQVSFFIWAVVLFWRHWRAIRTDCSTGVEEELVDHSNMVLDVITFQTIDFLCHLSRTTKHCKSYS